MLTTLLYLFNAVVLIILGARSYSTYQKNSVNLISKRFIGIGFVTALAYLLLIVDIYFQWIGNTPLSVLFDAVAVMFFYFSMMFAAVLAGDLLHRPKIGKSAAIFLLILGLYVFMLNLQIEQTTVVNGAGIVTYPNVSLSTNLFSLSVLSVYTVSFFIFIKTGIVNQHIRTKMFLLGTGLLVATWSGAGLIVAQELSHYIITYAVLFLGYVLQLAGIFAHAKSEVVVKRNLWAARA